MFDYIALNRLDEAKATYEQALERKLIHPFFHRASVSDCFLAERCGGDGAAGSMVGGQAGSRGRAAGVEADTAAYSGRLRDAREFSRRAMDSAERAEEKETAATYSAVSGLREALFGNAEEARRRATGQWRFRQAAMCSTALRSPWRMQGMTGERKR